MNQNASSTRGDSTPLASSFERYLHDKGKGRGGEGGNYRRNAARELQRFLEWVILISKKWHPGAGTMAVFDLVPNGATAAAAGFMNVAMRTSHTP